MSVKVHEAVCIDSAQDRYFWFDHFLGDQVQDEWSVGGTGTGAVVDAQTGGIIRLTTGATTDNAMALGWANIRSLLVTKRTTLEFRSKLSATASIYVINMLFFDWSNYIGFKFDTGDADTNWQIRCVDGGGSTTQDSGIAADTSYHIFRIEGHTHGSSHVHFYIDGTETSNSPITTNIPDDAADVLQPYLRIQTRAEATKAIDTDYVVVRQDR